MSGRDIITELRSEGGGERQYQREARIVLQPLLERAALEIEALRAALRWYADEHGYTHDARQLLEARA